MYKTSTQIRVRYSETDQMRVVYHSHYFQYFEVARTDSIRQLGLTYADMEEMGVIMPVVEVKCRYIKPAVYDDLLTVTVALPHFPLEHKVTFQSEVFNEKQELLAIGSVTLYVLDVKTMRKTRLPETLLEKLRPYYPSHE